MLLTMNEAHQREVLSGKKSYEAFCVDFISINTYIDCYRAECLNYHNRNVNIAKRLLENRKLLARHLFEQDFDEEAFTCLMYAYYHQSPAVRRMRIQKRVKNKLLKSGYVLTEVQIAGLAGIAAAHGALRGDDPLKTKEMLADMLNCKRGTHIKVAKLQPVVLMLDALMRRDVVRYGWQSFLEKGKFLLDQNGNLLKSSTLSTNLSRAKNNIKLKKAIDQALAELFT